MYIVAYLITPLHMELHSDAISTYAEHDAAAIKWLLPIIVVDWNYMQLRRVRAIANRFRLVAFFAPLLLARKVIKKVLNYICTHNI